jgi:hypothetical protein
MSHSYGILWNALCTACLRHLWGCVKLWAANLTKENSCCSTKSPIWRFLFILIAENSLVTLCNKIYHYLMVAQTQRCFREAITILDHISALGMLPIFCSTQNSLLYPTPWIRIIKNLKRVYMVKKFLAVYGTWKLSSVHYLKPDDYSPNSPILLL